VVTDAKGGKADITTADVEQSNGVVHVIDSVLMPRAPIPTLTTEDASAGSPRPFLTHAQGRRRNVTRLLAHSIGDALPQPLSLRAIRPLAWSVYNTGRGINSTMSF
jgi:hypothetical protein